MLRKFMKLTRSRAGFSLVELMIVVAIIGMLAAVGIPQYAKFQAKARQSEGKAALSAAFNAARSFQSEWQTYSTDLKNIGMGVEGRNLRYLTGFASVTCASVAGGGSYNGPPENGNTWTNAPNVNTSGATWDPRIVITNTDSTSHANVGSSCAQNNFRVVAAGIVINTPAGATAALDVASRTSLVVDRWAIDENKNVTLQQLGF